MKSAFFIVGPTATGKSELAAEVARKVGGEIVSADAFQIYRGLDLLTAKPDAATLASVPHHLVGSAVLTEEMNVEIFRNQAVAAIQGIEGRGKRAIVVGGSGLYIKALTHGLAPLPARDANLREELEELTTDELGQTLSALDPATTAKIDLKNRRRVIRALEIFLLTGTPAFSQRFTWESAAALTNGVCLVRDRDDLYARINQRVERIFAEGVIEEVRACPAIGATAAKTLGFPEIRAHIAGKVSRSECIAAIQQATRRYAKRQLTWFRRQTNFESLNLSLLSHGAAVEWITERVHLSSR